MEKEYIEEQTFDQVDYTEQALPVAVYATCSFLNCNFSDSNLSGVQFIECSFNNCNLSMAKLGKTAFRDVRFKDCKMLGLHFEHCHELLFSIHLEHCVADHSSFYGVKLKKAVFSDSSLKDADFVEADFSGAAFDGCDLMGAHFENTILEKTDFRTAYNYTIDPALNKVKKARFSLNGVAGLLRKYDIVIE